MRIILSTAKKSIKVHTSPPGDSEAAGLGWDPRESVVLEAVWGNPPYTRAENHCTELSAG